MLRFQFGRRVGAVCMSSAAGGAELNFDATVLRFLACPLTKTPLQYDEAAQELVSEESGLAFPIIDGVPHLDPASARALGSPATAE